MHTMCTIYNVIYPYTILSVIVINDMIKEIESDVRNIDVALLSERGNNFICFCFSLSRSVKELLISLHLCIQRLRNLDQNVTFGQVIHIEKNIKTEHCRHDAHSP